MRPGDRKKLTFFLKKKMGAKSRNAEHVEWQARCERAYEPDIMSSFLKKLCMPRGNKSRGREFLPVSVDSAMAWKFEIGSSAASARRQRSKRFSRFREFCAFLGVNEFSLANHIRLLAERTENEGESGTNAV